MATEERWFRNVIAHMILNVKDFVESEYFYDQILKSIGFVCNHREVAEGVSVKSYIKHGHNLWIRHDANSEPHEFVRNVGLDHIAFSVDTKEQVDHLFHTVSALPVKVTREPRHYPEYSPRYYAFYFRDPNGIPLEICMM